MGIETLVITVLVVILLLALISYVPLDPDMKRWAYIVVIVVLLIWLLRGFL